MNFIKIIAILIVFKLLSTIFENSNNKNKIILFYSLNSPPSMKFLLTWKKYLQEKDLHKDNFMYKETYECDNNYKLCKKYNIKKYPTVLMFYKNKKYYYNGSNNLISLYNFINKAQIYNKRDVTLTLFINSNNNNNKILKIWNIFNNKIQDKGYIYTKIIDIQYNKKLIEKLKITKFPCIVVNYLDKSNKYYNNLSVELFNSIVEKYS